MHSAYIMHATHTIIYKNFIKVSKPKASICHESTKMAERDRRERETGLKMLVSSLIR
jgi:hypothetical protein